MSKPGLAADPNNPLGSAGLRLGTPTILDPYGVKTGSSLSEIMGAIEANTQAARNRFLQPVAPATPQPVAPPAAAPQEAIAPQVAFSPSTGKISVNGFTFEKDDIAALIESESYFDKPAPLNGSEAPDWRRHGHGGQCL